MKSFLFTLITSGYCLFVSSALAQDHTKCYVTAAGDTVKVHDVVRISDQRNFKHVCLYTVLDGMRHNAANRYLQDIMPGKTFSIARLSRIPSGSGYQEIAVLRILDPSIHRRMAVEYWIRLEKALQEGEVTLIKSSKSQP